MFKLVYRLKNRSMKKIVLVLMAVMGVTACNNTKEIKIIEPPKELILNVVQNIDGDLGQFTIAKNEKIKITFKKKKVNHYQE